MNVKEALSHTTGCFIASVIGTLRWIYNNGLEIEKSSVSEQITDSSTAKDLGFSQDPHEIE